MRTLEGVAYMVLVLLLGAQPGAGAWGMAAHDAQRTAHADGTGPATDDVAFQVTLPGDLGPMVLRDGVAYVATENMGLPDQVDALWRVDLDTAAVSRVAELDFSPLGAALAGDLILLTRAGGVEAYALDGTKSWAWDAPKEVNGTVTCNLNVELARAFLACSEVIPVVSLPATPTMGPRQIVQGWLSVYALRLTDGVQEWAWHKNLDAEVDQQVGLTALSMAATWSVGEARTTVGKGLVAVYARERIVHYATGWAETRNAIWVLDEPTGSLLWRANGTITGMADYSVAAVTGEQINVVNSSGGYCVFGDEALFVRLDGVESFALRRRVPLWATHVGRTDDVEARGGMGMGLDGERLYAATAQGVTALDPETGVVTWQHVLDEGLALGGAPIITTDSMVILSAWRVVDGGFDRLAAHPIALDAATGKPLWSREFPSKQTFLVAADGEHVAVLLNGNFTTLVVVGASGASLKPHAEVSSAYPAVGDPVRLDAGAAAGAFGPAHRYRVDWGDGTVTSWRRGTVFEHSYGAPGDRTVRVQAENEANQTASHFLVLHVGAVEPNFLSTAFAPENQNVTFFIIGLAVTLFGGFVGFLRLRHRLRILQRELERINRTYEQTRARVAECERALVERRAYAHVLLQDGKIDEAKFAVLEKRIDELLRNLRTGVLDDRFDFLPRGMARRLEQMLGDGRITAWEREHFLVALRADNLLTPPQKRQVEVMVDGWFRRDAAP